MLEPSHISHYKITAKIGEGGMGTVYRATDTKLNRDVAIKVLPPTFSEDAGRMQRFEREAQLLASLNHPNIASIYGIEAGAIVMELVGGEDLKGPVPVDTAVAYARQIAAALEAAHEKGIVHRDLKPANIKVTPDGAIKLLDFGLAKASEQSAASSSAASPTMSPTLSLAMTQAGMILGTAAYMSPEQARGKPVDKRADIWAFGVVLFEMLSGRQMFAAGDTVTDIIAAVVTREPDWGQLPKETPRNVRRLLQRCLKKDPKQRLRDIGDARLMLDEAEEVEAPPPALPASAKSRRWMAGCAVLAVGLAGLAAVHFRETPPQPEVIRFEVAPPEGGSFATNRPALSPDGRKLVFGARAKSAALATLWVRSLDTLELTALPGTDGAWFPFWSPDGRTVGFWAEGRLKRVDLAGGPPQEIANTLKYSTTGNAASTWSPDGYIYFGAGSAGLFRVPQSGGEISLLAAPGKSENSYFYPQLLPDGKHLLYHAFSPRREENTAYITTLDGKQRKRVLRSLQASAFVPAQGKKQPAHLVFLRQATLMAQPVDGQTYEVRGDPFPIAQGVGSANNYGFFAVSDNGTLVYRSGESAPPRRLQWLDRSGKVLSTVGEPAQYYHVAISRDGRRAIVMQQEGSRALWTIDLERNTPSRFTFEDSDDTDGVWSPDGLLVAFSSRRKGLPAIYLKDANGTKPEQELASVTYERPSDWSDDNRTLLFSRNSGGAQSIWALTNPAGESSTAKATPYLETANNTTYGQFAPGPGAPRWVAYCSDESRRFTEVFVQSFPAGGGKFQISNGGGTQPRWSRDGKELFYLGRDQKLMVVDVKMGSGFQAGTPRALFEARPGVNSPGTWRYDVAPDGKRFLFITAPETENAGPESMTIVTNWLAGVKR